jgi:hypothetical protein
LATTEARGENAAAILAIKLLALTGCRRGEIERLRWSEVDLPCHCLRLSNSKEGKSIRPLGQPVIELLSCLTRNGEFVLASGAASRPFSGLPKAWRRIMAGTQLRQLTPHGLRHGYASTASDLGYAEPTIAALLGHATVTMTGRYIHHLDAALIAAADAVSARIAAALNGQIVGADVVRLRGDQTPLDGTMRKPMCGGTAVLTAEPEAQIGALMSESDLLRAMALPEELNGRLSGSDLLCAIALLQGFAEVNEWDKDKIRSAYLEEGSLYEQDARRAISRLLDRDAPLPREVRTALRDLFVPDPPAWEQRTIRLVARRPGRPSDHLVHTQVAEYIWREGRNGKRLTDAIIDAADKFSLSDEAIKKIWSRYHPLLERIWHASRSGGV